MVQTDLKSDNLCDFNTSAAPFYYILDHIQNKVQYNSGEVGVFTGVGIHTPSEVVKVSNFLSDRGNYLTSCIPPVPPMLSNNGYESDASLTNSGPPLQTQGFVDNRNDALNKLTNDQMKNNEHFRNLQTNNNNNDDLSKVVKGDGSVETLDKNQKMNFLLPETTNVKRSAADYSGVNWQAGFSGNPDNLYTDPQNLTYVIERMWLERGGLDSNQLLKQSQEYFVPKVDNGCSYDPTFLPSKNFEGILQKEATSEKIRKPYDSKYPFGLPIDLKTGQSIREKQSVHYNDIDVTSVGISTPLLQQNNNLPFNEEAKFTNGGCNQVSFLKNNKMCSNGNTDMTSTYLPPLDTKLGNPYQN